MADAVTTIRETKEGLHLQENRGGSGVGFINDRINFGKDATA